MGGMLIFCGVDPHLVAQKPKCLAKIHTAIARNTTTWFILDALQIIPVQLMST
jgi:hypothetical protein